MQQQESHCVAEGVGREVAPGTSFAGSGVMVRLGDLAITCDGEDIAAQVWGAGATLAAYLARSDEEGGGRSLLQDRPEVVEVGSGMGVVGLAAAMAGASRVVLTDLPEHVPRLRGAIAENAAALEGAGAVVTAEPLPWGDEDAVYDVAPTGCDVVLGSDLCYNPDLFDALLRTLHELAQIRGSRVLVATEQRWEHVNECWAAALARSQLECVRTVELPTPPRIPRPVLLQELRVRDD